MITHTALGCHAWPPLRDRGAQQDGAKNADTQTGVRAGKVVECQAWVSYNTYTYKSTEFLHLMRSFMGALYVSDVLLTIEASFHRRDAPTSMPRPRNRDLRVAQTWKHCHNSVCELHHVEVLQSSLGGGEWRVGLRNRPRGATDGEPRQGGRAVFWACERQMGSASAQASFGPRLWDKSRDCCAVGTACGVVCTGIALPGVSCNATVA